MPPRKLVGLALMLAILSVYSGWIVIPVNGQVGGTIIVIIRCGDSTGCAGFVPYGAPISVNGSVRAHRTDASSPDVNASFTAADQGHCQLVVPPGVYDVYASAVGYQMGHLSAGTVQSGESVTLMFSLQPCAGAGCTPVPEFGSATISFFVAAVLVSMVLMTWHRRPSNINRRKRLER
jgi:hypothetical protein